MMRNVAAFILSIVVSQGLLAQPKINYTISNGVHFQGVDQSNPVIYDNDMVLDTPEMFYLWLKANRREVNLVGNISTIDGHPQGYAHDLTYKEFTDAYSAYRSIGGQNVPAPVKGSSRVMTNGQTTWENSTGSDLIISEAKKASPAKPLVIFVGGQVTTIANAFLKDRSIRDNIIVFHVDGYGGGDYNAIDGWACRVLLDNGVKYVNWDGDLNYWYNKPGSPGYSGSNKMPGIDLSTMPSNAFTNMLRSNWYNQAYSIWGDIGDGPPILYFFNHSLWQDVQRKNMQNQDMTADNFAFLLVKRNDWNAYGPQLNAVLIDPNSYIPASQPGNQSPSVNITSPSNNAAFAIGTPITLTVNASDPDGSVTRVEFFSGTTKIGEDLSSPYSFVWNNVTAGTYSITAKATDNVSATTTSTAVSITIRANVAPTVSITAPTNNATFTAGSTITISANASDPDGSIAKVEFYNGNTKLGEDTSSPHSFAWTSAVTGNYSLTARAYDNLGAVTNSGAVSVTMQAPANVSPAVSITGPAHNSNFMAGSSVTITVNASDSDGSVSKVEFFHGTTKLGEDASAPYNYVWSSVGVGTYTITAKATDNAGATGNSSAVSISVVANLPPTVTMTAPANNATFNAGSSVTISANASDTDGTISKVEFFSGSSKLGEDNTAPYGFAWNSVTAGTYSISVKATDNKGATAVSEPRTITVTAPNTPPTVSITSPANNANFNTGSDITISANASDANGSIVKVEFFNGSNKIGEDATAPYNFVWNDVENGNYILIAKATDNQNSVTSSTGVNVVVRTVPVPPVVKFTGPANGSSHLSSGAISITATASTPTGSILKVEFFNGSAKLGEDATAPYSFNWTNATPGTHIIRVKATSNQSLASTDEITIQVTAPATPPQLPPNNPPIANAGDDITEDVSIKTLTLNGSGTDADGQVTTYLWTQVSGPAEISLTQNNSGELNLTNLIPGMYVFELTVTDDNNLTGTDQVTVTIHETPVAANIPRYFTPNNDGVNDFWEWKNLEEYENSTLVIFNRFGQKIFETDSYQNNWNGTVDGKPLQEDAYYYNIRLNHTDIKGAVRIVR